MGRSHLPAYLARLRELRLVERRLPVTVTPARRRTARSGRYHLSDPYFRFYFRFIVPYALQSSNGRTIIVPIVWYPRLWYGAQEERENLEIIGDGTIVHWPQLDEDLSVQGLLAGRRSGESQRSLKQWLEERGTLRTP